MARSNRKTEFAERISWPVSLWAFLGVMVGSIFLTFWAPFNFLFASTVTIVFIVALIYAHYKSRLDIVVINGWLYVGNAKIEMKYIKSAKELNKKQLLKIRGPAADPAAFNATRYWIKTGVKVELKDKADPTPYWLISSRKAKALTDCLN
jgi:hypothetical protein